MKRNFVIMLTVVCLCTVVATGQTWREQYPNQPLSFNDVAFVDTLHGWLISSNCSIWHSTDGGSTWAPQSSGILADLRKIFLSGTEAAWIVGNDGTILKSVDGGARWQEVEPPIRRDFTDVFFLNSGIGWVASSTHLLRTSDDGATWTAFPTTGLRKVEFFNDQLGWGHGNGAALFKTTDGGETWSTAFQLPSNFVENHQIHDIMITSSTELTIAGFGYDHHNDWSMKATTTDGGTSWNLAPREYWNYLTNVTRFGQDSLFVFAKNGAIYRGDTRFTGNYPSFQKMTFVNPTHWWNATGSGEVHKTSDGGFSWQQLLAGVTSDLAAVAFVDHRRGWAAGSGGLTVHTSDGGQTWVRQQEEVLPSRANIFDLHFVSPVTGWLLSSYQDFDLPSSPFRNTVHYTTDSGKTWGRTEIVSARVYSTLNFVDEQNGWLGGWYGSILHSSDGGKTWSLQYQDDTTYTFPDLRRIHDISFIDEQTGWAVGQSGRIMNTTDGGQTWSVQFLDSLYDFRRVKFFDNQKGWIFAEWPAKYLLKTSDGGRSWETDSLPANKYDWVDVILTSWQKGILKVNGTIYFTQDGGKTWPYTSVIPSYSGNRPVRSMTSGGENTFWFVGDKEWILRLDQIATSIGEKEIRNLPRSFFLYQNYPNPFNPSTEIGYQISEVGYVTLKVYDVLGKEVAMLVQGEIDAGRHTVAWDASGLPSRIYLYRMSAGAYRETKRMLLLK